MKLNNLNSNKQILHKKAYKRKIIYPVPVLPKIIKFFIKDPDPNL